MSINPSDQQELSRLFSGQSAGHCGTCGSEKVEVRCTTCAGKGLHYKTGIGYMPFKCLTCQGRGVRTVCAVCQQVTP